MDLMFNIFIFQYCSTLKRKSLYDLFNVGRGRVLVCMEQVRLTSIILGGGVPPGPDHYDINKPMCLHNTINELISSIKRECMKCLNKRNVCMQNFAIF